MLTGTQLSLLDYQPSPEEIEASPAHASRPTQRTLLDWYECQASHYLTLILRIQAGRLATSIKMAEITRLHTLRQQALAKIKEIEHGRNQQQES